MSKLDDFIADVNAAYSAPGGPRPVANSLAWVDDGVLCCCAVGAAYVAETGDTNPVGTDVVRWCAAKYGFTSLERGSLMNGFDGYGAEADHYGESRPFYRAGAELRRKWLGGGAGHQQGGQVNQCK